MVSCCGQWLSVVVRRPSTFDVYTLETTVVIRFLWNLVRMFVLTISRISSNMGHVRSKTRSPGQILGNSCLHSIEARFATRFWWNFVTMFVLKISRPSFNMGHVWSKTRSPGQILGNSCLHSRGNISHRIFSSPEHKVLMVCYCGQWVSVVVRCPSTFDVYTRETTFVIRFLWNLVRMFVLTISRPSSNKGHVRSKTRSPGQILGNSCLHSRGQICDPILMNLDQNVCLSNF